MFITKISMTTIQHWIGCSDSNFNVSLFPIISISPSIK